MSKQLIELHEYTQIIAALKIGPVFCDIVNPNATHIPVRNARHFKSDGIDPSRGVPLNSPEWTSRVSQGLAKGYEVLVLEGWRVPERVYVEKEK